MNPMELLRQFMGNDKFNEMLREWNSLTQEQKNAELNRIKSLSPEQQNEILRRVGVDVNSLNSGKTNSRFKF